MHGIHRIIDANANRAHEGLRVCEEVSRFILNNQALTSQFKALRHSLRGLIDSLLKKRELLKERRSDHDVGKNILGNELSRTGSSDIFFANIQRSKESIRVLEEFSKLINKNVAVKFKRMRYKIYLLEQKTAKTIDRISNDPTRRSSK